MAKNSDKSRIIFIIIVLLIVFSYTLILTLFTRFQKKITIKSKYIRNTRKNKGDYFIVDTDNNSYILSDNLYLLQFDKTDDYNLIEENKTYIIYGYGFRIHFLNMYPKVYDLKKV